MLLIFSLFEQNFWLFLSFFSPFFVCRYFSFFVLWKCDFWCVVAHAHYIGCSCHIFFFFVIFVRFICLRASKKKKQEKWQCSILKSRSFASVDRMIKFQRAHKLDSFLPYFIKTFHLSWCDCRVSAKFAHISITLASIPYNLYAYVCI